MAKYLLLYHGGSMPETDAERGKVMAAWETWFKGLGSAVADPGNPFSQIKAISSSGSVSNGGGGSNAPSGYSVIEADSLDKAVAHAKACPVLEGGASIEVCETFNVM
jgi:hypothetical protein